MYFFSPDAFSSWKEEAKQFPTNQKNKLLFSKAALLFAFFLLTATFPSLVFAAVFTVNTTADNESNGCAVGQCTLREAIEAANSLPGSDTINFQAGSNGAVVLNGGALFITSDIAVNGPGARLLSVSGNGLSRVFVVSGSGVTASIKGLTITGGNAQPILLGTTLIGDGGGVLNTNGATLRLTEVNVSGNLATSLGGGVATRSLLGMTTSTYITRSLVSNNQATGGGSGISNAATAGIIGSAVTSVANSTVALNNTVAEGGGISNVGGTLNLVNDTICDNTSALAGGGVVNVAGILGLGVTNLRNTMIARNNAVLVGGVLNMSDDVFGFFNSLGNNLIGNRFNAETSFQASAFVGADPVPNVNGDLVGSVSLGTMVIDPRLGSLQNNGGPTNKLAVLAGSPAIDRGNNCVQTDACANDPSPETLPEALATDQRGAGFSRVTNSNVEIGAYEIQLAPTAAGVTVSGQVTDEYGKPVSRVTVTLTDASGNARRVLTNQFGHFLFTAVPTGEIYVAGAVHRRYSFAARVLNVSDSISDLNFSAESADLKLLSKPGRFETPK